MIFINAIAALKRMLPQTEIIGLMFGRADKDCREATMLGARQLGVAEAIRLMNFQPDPEIWLSACDCLLAPAVEEPFGRTIIEAMLVGTPVVASNSGGNPEAIRDGETGVLATPDDPVAMGHAVKSVLTSKGFADYLTRNARKDALIRFGIEQHVRDVVAVYDKVLGAGAHPRCVSPPAEFAGP
jgi:glycosyltransferase involved in cell wall biosynthesis